MAWHDVTKEGLQKYGLMVGIPAADSEDELPGHDERFTLLKPLMDQLEQDFPNMYGHIMEGASGAYDAVLATFGPRAAGFAAHIELCITTWMWLQMMALRDANEANGAKRERKPKILREAEAVAKGA